jgi:hypothetical protein
MPASDLAQTEARRHAEAGQRTRLPVRAVVKNVLPSLEALDIQMALDPGISRVRVRHPYIGANSWIRVMPEAGTEIFTQQRGDEVMNEIFGYYSTSGALNVSSYQQEQLLYRDIISGEMEFMSNGRAYIYLGESGDLETRGGTIRHELLQSKLELRSIAPTYVRKLHTSPPYTLANEERFGVVKRPDPVLRNTFQQYVTLPNTDFAVEHSRWLNTKAGLPIIELQEGDVYDEFSSPVLQSSTNRSLRYQKKVYHKTVGELTHQIDEDLNILLANTSTAAETKVDLGKKNVLRITAKDVKATFLKTGSYNYATSLTTTSPTTKFNASSLFTVEGPKAHLKAPLVHCGTSPSIPLALATQTVTTFNILIGAIQGLSSALSGAFAPPNPVGVAAQAANAAASSALATVQQIPSKQVIASG